MARNSRMSLSRPRALWPTVLIGVLAICFTITILVGWSIIFTKYYSLTNATDAWNAPGMGYWLILSTGCVFLVLIIVALTLFLISIIRQTLYVRQQDTFIDSVTHELKSPLASILLSLDTMEMRKLTPERHARLMGMMRKDAERLQAFIEHVLEASRLEHDRHESLQSPVHLGPLIQRCVMQACTRHGASMEEINVELALPRPEAMLMTDVVAMEIVLLNLLDNAIKYSPEGVEVEVRVDMEEEDTLRIAVRDHGLGLEKRQRKKVFRRFHRVSQVDHPRIRGMGLGLYVVKGLVRRMGGKISAQSAGVGQGSTFTVTVPAQWVDEEETLGEHAA